MRPFMKSLQIIYQERRLPWFLKKRMSVEYIIKLITIQLFKLIRLTPKVISHNESDYEICTLLDRGNIDSYLVAIKSFSINSPINCRITIISDGSLRQKEKNILRRHIEGVNIFSPFDIKDTNDDLLAAMKEARIAIHTIRKTYDIYQAITSKNIIFMDSDIIVRKPLDAFIFDVGNEIKIRYNKDHDHSIRDPLFFITKKFIEENEINIRKNITDLNCGFMVFSSDVFKLDLIMQYILYLHQKYSFHTVMEQDSWNIVASTTNCEAMPESYVVGDFGADFKNKLRDLDPIMVHYVGGIRYKSFNYLIDGLKVIKKLFMR